jgi:hypothetical protein
MICQDEERLEIAAPAGVLDPVARAPNSVCALLPVLREGYCA